MWISRFCSTGSRVYLACKVRDKPCGPRGPKLDKKSAWQEGGGFAQSFLWICMGLSTLALAKPFASAGKQGCGMEEPVCGQSLAFARRSSCSVGRQDPENAESGACQVYTQKHVYRIVVVVNGAPHLWIKAFMSTTSRAYAAYKEVGCHCMCLVGKLDNICVIANLFRSPHSVPVDMQMLIHSWPAWHVGALPRVLLAGGCQNRSGIH
jgi:hypothetical protein